MSTYEIVTVATHECGTFNKLINNNFKIKIKVLGWNKKWEGFNMKYKLLLQYIKNLEDNKIIIFLDGFDSLIINDPNIAIHKFIKNNYKVLFSKENDNSNFYFFKKFIFKNSCNSKNIINSGLYMGYVKYLKIILQDCICDNCKDDQVVINSKCNNYDYISIDENHEIFLNMNQNELKYIENKNLIDSPIFIQTPGSINFNRIFRGLFEYCQFFIIELLIIIIIINYILLYHNQILLFIITNIIFMVYLYKIDISCIMN